MKNIGIIGYGNMGQAIVQSLLKYNLIDAKNLFISDRSKETGEDGLQVIHNNRGVVKKSDIIILAVKPQQMSDVLSEIKDIIQSNQLILSIAAGITIESIKKRLALSQPVIRIMPLLTTKIGLSMSVWISSLEVQPAQRESVRLFLKTFGEEVELESEQQIDAYTALAGGPAFVFHLAEILEENAQKLGFTKEQSILFARQIVFGSASLLEQSDENAASLRRQVISKGGTTEAAFTILSSSRLKDIYKSAIFASLKRAGELRIS